MISSENTNAVMKLAEDMSSVVSMSYQDCLMAIRAALSPFGTLVWSGVCDYCDGIVMNVGIPRVDGVCRCECERCGAPIELSVDLVACTIRKAAA